MLDCPKLVKPSQLDCLVKFYVNDLLKDGIDVYSNDEYYKSPKFEELKDTYILGFYGYADDIIEEYCISQDRLETIYTPYDLRIKRSLTQEELHATAWYNLLCEKYSTEKRTLTYKDVEQYFNRKANGQKNAGKGLIERINDLGIDIKNNKFIEQDRVRLLYFLFCFEHDENIRCSSLLQNPTLENVDNSLVLEATRNGVLIKKLKAMLAKGIRYEFVKITKEALFICISNIEIVIRNIALFLDISSEHRLLNELKCMDRNIDILLSKIDDLHLVYDCYSHTLLETFYLKLCQHENIGRINDIIDISDAIMSFVIKDDSSFITLWRKKYAYDLYDVIMVKDVMNYVSDKRDEIAKIIFNTNKITLAMKRKLDGAYKRLDNYINFLCINTALKNNSKVYVYYILACLNEFVFSDKVTFKNKFYRYATSDNKSIQKEIYNGKNALKKNQLAAISYLNWRVNSYSGLSNENSYVQKIITKIDMMTKMILKCNDLYSMAHITEMLIVNLKAISCPWNVIDKSIREFNKVLKRIGYTVDSENSRMFFGVLYDTATHLQIANDIVKKYSVSAEKSKAAEMYYIPIEMKHNLWNGSDSFDLILSIVPSSKKVIITSFELREIQLSKLQQNS